MHAELEDDLRQIAAVKAEAQRLLAGLSDAEFNRRPAPGRWSAAECLDHLNAIRKVLPAIDRTIAGARARGLRSDGPFRYGWFTRWMIRAFEPPPRRRFKNDLKRAIVVSPVSRFVRMPLGGYLAFLLAHDRRHLWQARAALGSDSGPA